MRNGQRFILLAATDYSAAARAYRSSQFSNIRWPHCLGGAGVQIRSLRRASARRIHLEAGNVFRLEFLATRLRISGARHSLAELDESTAQKGGAKNLQCAERSSYDGGTSPLERRYGSSQVRHRPPLAWVYS
jgi:hypothetical protein